MSKIAKPLEDHEVEFVDEDDSSLGETKKAESGFTPTQRVGWPWGKAAPLQEPESAEAAAGRDRGDAAKTNRVLENREEAEKARQDDRRPDPGGSIEAKYATGYTRVAGKYRALSGPLVYGSGRLKVIPGGVSAEQLDEWAERAPEFAKVAKQVLHGRSATIFEHRVLNPMLGHPGRSVADLAAQFNVTEKRIYKVEAQSLKKVRAAVLRQKQGKSLNAEDDGVCEICGHSYSDGTMCPRGNYGPRVCKWQAQSSFGIRFQYFGQERVIIKRKNHEPR